MRLSRWVIGSVVIGSVLSASGLSSQSVLERSPNIQGVWGLDSGRAVFVLSHRFEVIAGGDELFSVPTLTLAAGLPLRLTVGADFTSYSEAVPAKVTKNETQVWLKRPLRLSPRLEAAALVAYNTSARSVDGAADMAVGGRRLRVFAEARAFSSLFGSGDAAAGAAIGAALRLTEHLALTGDYGGILTEDEVPAAWSAAAAVEIPGSPHTLSLQVTNTGATTLQGASRRKTLGSESVRYGFSFTAPIGGPSRWARIFRPLAPAPARGAAAVRIRQFDYAPAEIVVGVGETVEWTNGDPVVHTVTATDGSWDSGSLADGEAFRRRFDVPGTYSYYCVPHPDMRGTVVVR